MNDDFMEQQAAAFAVRAVKAVDSKRNGAIPSVDDLLAEQNAKYAYERLLKSHEQFRKALCAIAYSSHCISEDTYSQYEIGVVFGHRRAALIAKEALKEND